MFNKLILTVFTGLLIHSVSAQQLPQQWVRAFTAQGKAPDRIAAITTDASGNVFIAGYAGNHHGAPDAFAMKRGPLGDTLWVYYYDGGGNNEDYATDITLDAQGNAYLTGHSSGTQASVFECFTAKILPSGTEAWASRYAPGGNLQSYGKSIVTDGQGNVYVAGYTDPLAGSSDWMVLKYNAGGTLLWADIMNGPGNGDDEATDIIIAPNGNPTACGYMYSVNASGGTNAFVKQYTPANGTAWSDTWNNTAFNGTDMAVGLGSNSAGDIFIGGETKNSAGFNRDMFAIRYNAAGVQQWATIYTDANTASDEYLLRVTVDPDGNLYYAGTDYLNGVVTCIYNNGTGGWRKEWSGSLPNGYDVFHAVTVDDAGNVYVTGRGVYPGPDYYGNGGLTNMIIAKYNANGDSLWTYRCADSLNASMGFAITSRNGTVYAGGFVTDTAYVDENLYTLIVDSVSNGVTEWIYNGRGDAITMGQFVVTDNTDHIYCAATTDRLYANGTDVTIIKYDPAGNLLWERYYSTPGWHNDTLTGMQLDPSGNLVLSISTDSAFTNSKFRLSLLKMDTDGNFLDTTWYNPTPAGSVLATSMTIRSDGGVALTANSNINGGMVIYFDNTFAFSWAAKIDSTQFAATRANRVALFSNGDILVGGYIQATPLHAGVIQRYDAIGTKLWTTFIDSANVYDEVRDVTVNPLDEVAFTGASGGGNTFLTILGKLNGANGNELWKQSYNPSTNNETGVKIRFTPAGNLALISRGWTGFVSRYFTVQFSGTGTFQWAVIYSNTASDREPVDLLVEPTNRVVTAGWAINGTTLNYDYVLTGYNAAGVTQFENSYSHTLPASSSWDQLYDLHRDSQGDFVVTGRSSSQFYNNFLYKILTLKFGGSAVGLADETPVHPASVYVYPNPSSNGIYTIIDASASAHDRGIIVDLAGRKVSEFSLRDGIIDLHHAAPGIYVLVLEKNGVPAERIRLVRSE